MFVSVFSIIYEKTTFKYYKVSNYLGKIGRTTLEIYLLHYFILRLFFLPMCQRYIAIVIDNSWEIPVTLIMSLGVTILCMLIVKVLKAIKVYNLFFPEIRKDDAFINAIKI